MNEEFGVSLSSSVQNTPERRARETRLFAYQRALESGDFEIVAAILAEAERDPALERMVLEINEAYVDEMHQTAREQEDAVLSSLLQKHFPAAYMDMSAEAKEAEDDVELPPLTVWDVLAHVRSGGDLSHPTEHHELSVLQHRSDPTEPIPQDLSGRSVRQFLARLGVTISKGVENAFRNTAILLAQGRQQDMAQLAATRRQRSASKGGAKQSADGSHHENASAAPPASETEYRP